MKNFTRLLFFLLLMLNTSFLMAQKQVKGTVSDYDGTTLPGVNILEVGTQNGTVSDIDGNYQLEVSGPDAELNFSFVGYEAQKVKVGTQATINVKFAEDLSFLNEVVVVGYGTQKRSNIAGAVTSVDVEKTNAIPTINVAEMLRGKAAGVQVTLGDARPGGSSKILIRGRKSLIASNDPLFIVDGVPVESIDEVNSADVKSIEVLKDAASQAIYGARASNGVILITTKRGSDGKLKITYNGYYGAQKLTRNFDIYSAEEWAQLKREAFRASSRTGEFLTDEAVFDSPIQLKAVQDKTFVNWEDLVLETAQIQKHDIGISGGNESTKTYLGLGFYDQNGLIPTSGFTRGSLRFNIDQKLSDQVSVGVNSYFSRSVQNIESGGINKYITLPPLGFPFDAEGEIVRFPIDQDKYNPLWNIKESTNEIFKNKNSVNLFLDVKLFKGFKYRLSGTSISWGQTGGKYLTTLHEGSSGNGLAQVYNRSYTEFLVENIIDYTKDINESHHLDFTFLQSINQFKKTKFDLKGVGFENDDLGYAGIRSAETQSAVDFIDYAGNPANSRKAILSFLGRVRYNFKEKYLLTLTARADAASVFGESDKWGYFPAAAFAWKIHEEDFAKKDWLDELKLRVSYGQTGNEAITPAKTISIATVEQYVDNESGKTLQGYAPGSLLPNPNLKWETSTTLNVGLDFVIFNQFLKGTVEFYNTNTTDLLVLRGVPKVTGYTNTYDNVGEVNNKGVELGLTANIITNDKIDWYATLNFSANKNKIIELYGVDSLGNSLQRIDEKYFVGEPINNAYNYVTDGIWQDRFQIEDGWMLGASPGDLIVRDTNGDGKITPDDQVVIGKDPKWYGSISTNFNYMGIELYADLYVVHGSKKTNSYLANDGVFKGRDNGVKLNYWTPENNSNDFPRPNALTAPLYAWDHALRNASYMRLRTLTVAYNFPENLFTKLGLSSARAYVTGTNLWTKTNYLSYSPENNPGQFPEGKSLTVGLNLSF